MGIVARSREYLATQAFYVVFIVAFIITNLKTYNTAKDVPVAVVKNDATLFRDTMLQLTWLGVLQSAIVTIHFYCRARLPIIVRDVVTRALHARYAQHIFAVQAASQAAHFGTSVGGLDDNGVAGGGCSSGGGDARWSKAGLAGTDVGIQIDNVDQRIVEDTEQLSRMMALFMTQFLGHASETVVNAFVLSSIALGSDAWTGCLLGFGVVSFLVTFGFVRSIALYTYASDRREGDFRFAHGRVREHAESVAFHGAAGIERSRIEDSFTGLLYVTLQTLLRRVPLNVLAAYSDAAQSNLVFVVVAVQLFYAPFGGSDGSDLSPSQLSQQLSLAVSLTSAVLGNVLRVFRQLYNEGPLLVGGTNRVMELFELFDALEAPSGSARDSATTDRGGGITPTPVAAAHGAAAAATDADTGAVAASNGLPSPGRGLLLPGELALHGVSVESPAGAMLVRDLSLRLAAGERLLVTGPNGVGKSALVRAIVGIWPLRAGWLELPRMCTFAQPTSAFVVPQRPFIPTGSLRDAVMFPSLAVRDGTDARGVQGTASMAAAGVTVPMGSVSDAHAGVDEDGLAVTRALDAVDLTAVYTRVGGIDAVPDVRWDDVLSVGEAQRVVLARLLFHAPQLAVVDEGTSAVTPAFEAQVYRSLAAARTTVVSVGHSRLESAHARVLELDGSMGWKLRPAAVAGDSRSELVDTTHEAPAERRRQMPRGPSAGNVPSLVTLGLHTGRAQQPRGQARPDGRAASHTSFVEERSAAYYADARARAAATRSVYSRRACGRLMRTLQLVTRGWRVRVYILVAAGVVVAEAVVHGHILSSQSSVTGLILARDDAVFAAIYKLLLWSAGVAVLAAVDSFLTGTRDSNSGDRFSSGFIGLACREVLQHELHDAYFADDNFYHALQNHELDGPDQRMVENARQLVYDGLDLVFTGIISTIITSTVLSLSFRGDNMLLALGLLGGPYAFSIGMQLLFNRWYMRYSYAVTVAEAGFRNEHIRVREHGESIALQGGAATQTLYLQARLAAAIAAGWAFNRFNVVQGVFFQVFGALQAVAAMAVPWIVFRTLAAAELSGTESAMFQQVALLQLTVQFFGNQLGSLQGLVSLVPDLVSNANRVFEMLEWLRERSNAIALAHLAAEGGRVARDDADARGSDRDMSVPSSQRACIEARDMALLLRGQPIAGARAGEHKPEEPPPRPSWIVRGLSFRVDANAAQTHSDSGGGSSGDDASRPSWTVPSLLITGPSGCGKTSILRALAGLWQPNGGSVLRPPRHGVEEVEAGATAPTQSVIAGARVAVSLGGVFFLPQVPFVVHEGSLADQVAYPDAGAELISQAGGEASAMRLLDELGLGYLADRCGDQGLAGVLPWSGLSMGELQRLSMARLLHHRPAVAVLDECSSAVSEDAEAFFYIRCRELGIAVVSVGHREALRRYHAAELQLSGQGDGAFEMVRLT